MFSNNFIEKTLGVAGTTRNPTMIKKPAGKDTRRRQFPIL
jgi:hypothetical protein